MKHWKSKICLDIWMMKCIANIIEKSKARDLFICPTYSEKRAMHTYNRRAAKRWTAGGMLNPASWYYKLLYIESK